MNEQQKKSNMLLEKFLEKLLEALLDLVVGIILILVSKYIG
jgi:hypothetical protein